MMLFVQFIATLNLTDHLAQTKQQDDKKANASVGFIKDYRRANVALTRAKRALWVVGNAQVLKSSPLWCRLVEQLEQYQVVTPMGDFKSMFARWKATQE